MHRFKAVKEEELCIKVFDHFDTVILMIITDTIESFVHNDDLNIVELGFIHII